LIEEEAQKGKVKGKIYTYPSKAGNRAIVNPPYIAIIIHYPVEDGVPPNKRDHEVTDEEGTQENNDVGFQAEISKRSILMDTEHGPESPAHTDTCYDLGRTS
jgi:hypothetical protein